MLSRLDFGLHARRWEHQAYTMVQFGSYILTW